MFISIPKDFFVPVVFGDKFTLNLDNMEFDTERNVDSKDAIVEDNNVSKTKNDSLIMSPFSNSEIYGVIDEEYVNSAIGMRKR